MTAVTIWSYFGTQENKISHCFHFFPIYLLWSDGTGCHDLSFLNVEFKPAFSLSSFTFNERFFSSSSLCHQRGIVCVSEGVDISPSNLESNLFFIQSSTSHPAQMYSSYKLNKQGGNIQPSYTHFPILSQFIVPCKVLTVASCPAYRFLRRQVKWSAIPISLRIFYSLLWASQSFSIVNEAEVDFYFIFLNSFAFL